MNNWMLCVDCQVPHLGTNACPHCNSDNLVQITDSAAMEKLLPWRQKKLSMRLDNLVEEISKIPDLSIRKSGGWVSIYHGSRYASICMTADVFLVDFWDSGTELAAIDTSDNAEVIEMVRKWFDGAKATELPSHAYVQPVTTFFERGQEAEFQWGMVEKRPGFGELVSAARKHDRLRQMFPFTSMNGLHFSRCTGYPYTFLPFIRPIQGGYEVYVNYHDPQLIGLEENVDDAIKVVLDRMPDTGPAVRGTADTL